MIQNIKNAGYTHTRLIARGFVLNKENKICLLHIIGEDEFGNRDYYESPGGGVEK
ncbi:MAG: complex I NDUFA12 subunit family protein [Clostridium sp.]|nr:MAG: complex I NDUFA12 subunit family protein [Clostridium sp.]